MIGAQAVADGPPASARLIRHAAQRTCRRSMRTATAALGTTMSRPSSLAISSLGAAKDCALSLTWSGRAAENAGFLKRQHRSRSQRRFPEDALVANVGCRRVSPVPECRPQRPLTEPTPAAPPWRHEALLLPPYRPFAIPVGVGSVGSEAATRKQRPETAVRRQ